MARRRAGVRLGRGRTRGLCRSSAEPGPRPARVAGTHAGQGAPAVRARVGRRVLARRRPVTRDVYEYAVIRVVPKVERGELINAGVLLYCQPRDYLCARVELDPARLRVLDPGADVDGVRHALSAYERACGDQPGPLAAEPLGSRFRWLTAPRSTVVQAGPVHAGLTADPDTELARLFDKLVRL
ncbi:MAG: DUF3037 domain-containing protein [Nonomuraea sp.]|nr:DUF3037 domain-containing protein [Nonomuraea sp.]NUP60832.1 DUF3037 domain-containing protein [Nonomuraea sp.]NUP81852.1 DUF3037 domain-containing protein [Nonomuraea sp.]NUS05566.1 DUF3037 domain-containing protein [Nonomuraea sp.]NUT11032.1 DUF3037 domain-containing protein [Nonomuraea sp.]